MRFATLLLAAGVLAASAQTRDAEPFTASARWAHYLHRTYSPMRMGMLGADAAFDHAFHDPSCWDSGASSYGRRYARAFERRVIRNSAELGGGLLTGEDLRYRISGSSSFAGRIWSAVTGSVTARMPDASRRPAYTRFAAGMAAEVSTAHWTHQAVRPSWLFESMGWSILDQVQTNLLDEFGPDMRRAGGRMWRRMKGGLGKTLPSPAAAGF